MTDVTIRPMRAGDVPVVERLSAEGFHELDTRTYPRDWPEPVRRSPERAEAWEARARHFLETDPGGSWVAEGDDGVAGFAISVNRELMWILASYAVRPGLQGQGIEFRLLVTDRTTGSGYVYVSASGAPVLLAATNRRTATDLAWAALAGSDPDQPVEVPHITAANEWLVDVGIAARMELHQRGYLGLRHMRPPKPYLHHGSFL